MPHLKRSDYVNLLNKRRGNLEWTLIILREISSFYIEFFLCSVSVLISGGRQLCTEDLFIASCFANCVQLDKFFSLLL